MRVIVSGATSMIGVALINKCINEKVEVIALVRFGTSRRERLPQSKYLRIVQYDLEQDNVGLCDGITADVFYHFAWAYTSKDTRDNPILQEKNIRFSLQMAELAKKCGCRLFVGAGSQAEYGVVDGPIDELTLEKPQIAYGIAKLAAKQLLNKYCKINNIKLIWGRIFSVYGKYDNENTMINYVVDCFISGKKAQLSSCEQTWNYLNEKDAGVIFYKLGVSDVCEGTYCVANTVSLPLKQYVEEIIKEYSEEVECDFQEGDQSTTIVNLNVQTKKLFETIDYSPMVPFAEGIREIVEYRKGIKKE